MSLKDTFLEIFSPVEHEAEAVAKSLAHFIEKELKMIPQPIQDLIDRIKTALSAHSDQGAADAKTISDLQASNAAKDSQIAQLTADGIAKDGQIAALTQSLTDTQAALQAIADQVPAPAPAPVPAADGSTSADVTP